MLPDSALDAALRLELPAMLDILGVPAVHLVAGDEVPVQVILRSELAAVGDYGERMETRWKLDILATSGAQVGDTFLITPAPTVDDPEPDPVTWTATQLLADDGLFRQLAVRSAA